MKPAAVIFVFIISIASVYSRGVDEDLLHGRARRDVRSRNNGAAACLPKVTVAAQTCGKELDEKVKARENEDGQDIKCCIYAEFRRCVTTFAEKYCDKDVASVVETVIKGIMNTLNNQCSDRPRLCAQGTTCCTEAMEYKLSTHSRDEFDRRLGDAIGETRKVLLTRTQKFDEFFRELLKNSKRDFHTMFLQTYGLLYERNAYIFTDMFADLERYYMTGTVDLTVALDGFFQRLYRKMFQVLNTQYSFDETYLQCVGPYMDELKPFGDIPKKLKIEVKRSFVATRTFVQALSNGKDVLAKIMEVRLSLAGACSKALMKITYCPHCQGLADLTLKPCPSFCSSVMRTCLASHTELNKEWNNYIDALLLLSSRLETSFNIESVVDPIDIKISEAIMNFQENGIVVSQKLFEKCGKPRIGKREAKNNEPLDGEELMDNGFDDFNTYRSHPQAHSSRMVAAGTSMDRLLQDIKRKIKRTKDHWSRLPETLCSPSHSESGSFPRDQSRSCWNGTGTISSDLDKFDAFASPKRPEVHSSQAAKQNALIAQQILTLKLVTSKVNHAYNGLEVDWQDNGDTDDVSGSGSGASPIDSDAEEDGDLPIPESGMPHPSRPSGGRDSSDIYFGPTESPDQGASSTPMGNNPFVTHVVPNTRYSTRMPSNNFFPNNINVLNSFRSTASRATPTHLSTCQVTLAVCFVFISLVLTDLHTRQDQVL